MQSAVNALANQTQQKLGEEPCIITEKPKFRPDGSTMKAAAWYGIEDVRVVDVSIPDITDPDDVIIKITGTTICGSDLHLYHGDIPTMQKGDILGHEFMGIIDKVGPNVKKLQVGQRVVSSFSIACGQCEYCKQKLFTFCDNTNKSSLQPFMYGQKDSGIFGYSHFTGGYSGGQAEFARVPIAEVNLLPIVGDIPDEKVLYLSDILPTSYHCVVDTGVKEGDVVGIWGLGPIGICTARWAQLKGASRVIGIDKYRERLDMARDKLGIDVIDFATDTDVVKRIYELVPRGLDVALNCSTPREPKSLMHKVQKVLKLETDVPENVNEMLTAVKKGGRCGLIGDNVGFANGVNLGALMEKGIRLIGNGQAPVPKYWHDILNNYVLTGEFDVSFLVTHRVPLEDTAKLYAAFDKRQGGVEKVFIETQFSNPPSPGFPKTTRVDEWAH